MAKYNEKTVSSICKYLEDGMLQKDSAILSGVSKATFYRWLKDNKTFKTRVEASLLKYKEKLIKIVNIRSIEDGKLALEMLARRWPEEFSAKHQVEVINPQVELDRIKKVIDEKHNDKKDEKKGNEKQLVSGHSTDPLQE